MIQAVFSDSAAGSLKYALARGKGQNFGGSLSMVMHPSPSPKELARMKSDWIASEQRRWEGVVPLAGEPKDVLSFHLVLSMFDINDSDFWTSRTNALKTLYAVFPENETSIADVLVGNARDSLSSMLSRLNKGEPLRIWFSEQPDEMCGLCWLMAQLPDDCPSRITVLRLPAFDDLGDNLLWHTNGWGEITPELFSSYIPFETPVSPLLRRALSQQWRDLQQDNAALRVTVNGRIISAAESFYDPLIKQHIDTQSSLFSEARLIGEILCKSPLGISDALIARRLDAMIASGELTVATPAPFDAPKYHRMLQKQTVS